MKYEIIDSMLYSFFSSECDLSDEESESMYRDHMSSRVFGEPMLKELSQALDDDFSWKKLLIKHEVVVEPCSEKEARDLAKELLLDPILKVKSSWES